MHRCNALWTVLIVVLLAASPALGQMCGDVNEDGGTTIGDLVMILDHIAVSGVPLPSQYAADCDQRAGITVGDAQALATYFFQTNIPPTCPPTMDYSFALSEADTVFLPMMSSIPEIYTQVTLPILTSFAENTDAFYLPIAFGGGGSSGQFSPNDVEIAAETPPAMGGAVHLPDSIVCFGTSFESGGFSGRNEFINVICVRKSSGPATLTSAAYERSSLWKIAVVKDGDLYTPVIVYREIPVPPPSVTVEPTSIGFTAMAGNFDPNTYDITISGDGGVSFELETSDDWIIIQDFQPGGYTTPVTITVQGDGTYLGIGDHFGTISIINPYPVETEFNTTVIDVSFHSTDPFALPVGDLNCDGVLSISDIAIMIDHLFIHPEPIPPCQ